MMSLKWIKGN